MIWKKLLNDLSTKFYFLSLFLEINVKTFLLKPFYLSHNKDNLIIIWSYGQSTRRTESGVGVYKWGDSIAMLAVRHL